MQKESAFFQILLYCLCTVLVVLYVNLYVVWGFVNQLLPPAAMEVLPVVAVFVFVVVVLFCYARNKQNISKMSWYMVGMGGALCLFALLLPDGQFPVKRVHVVEYMLLACLVRYTMSWRLHGTALLFFSVLVTVLFGIHDELLQGIHPSRTYGLRDILVNSVAAVGGGFIWHGGSLFVRLGNFSQKMVGRKEYKLVAIYLCWLCLSVLAFIIPLTAYRQEVIPYWPLLPISAGLVLWSMYSAELHDHLKYGCSVVSCLIYTFLVYPVVINV